MSRTLRPTRPHLRSAGFTLIELIVVIVILGVLAATALPKFINMRTDARIASLTHLAGTLRSAAEMLRAKCLATGCSAFYVEYVTLNGVSRAVWYGYPIENSRSDVFWGINELVQTEGFDYTFSTGAFPRPAYFSPTGAPDPTNCRVAYVYGSSSNTPPTITMETSGC